MVMCPRFGCCQADCGYADLVQRKETPCDYEKGTTAWPCGLRGGNLSFRYVGDIGGCVQCKEVIWLLIITWALTLLCANRRHGLTIYEAGDDVIWWCLRRRVIFA